jgi:hypothetical protein
MEYRHLILTPTLSQRAERVPHLFLDTGRQIFSFQRSSVGMPDLTLCVRGVAYQLIITKWWISSSNCENTPTRHRASPLHSTTAWWNEDLATLPCLARDVGNDQSSERERSYPLSLWADRVPYFLLDTGKFKNVGELERIR